MDRHRIAEGSPLEIVMRVTDALIPGVARRVHLSPIDFARRLKSVNVITSPLNQSYTDSADNWKTFEVHVHAGFLLTVADALNAYWARMAIADSPEDALSAPSASYEQVLGQMRLIGNAYWRSEYASISGFPLRPLQDDYFYSSLRGAWYFLLAHEFGHIVARLRGTEKIQALDATHEVVKLLTHGRDLTKQSNWRDVFVNWTHEIIADTLAVELVLDLAHERADKRDFTAGVLIGIEFFFLCFEVLAVCAPQTAPKTLVAPRYPPPSDRLDIVRKMLNYPSTFRQVPLAFQGLSDKLCKDLSNKSVDHYVPPGADAG